MAGFLTRLIVDKSEWKAMEAMEARAKLLPGSYRVVSGEVTSYLWRFTAGDGNDEATGLAE